MKYGSPSSSAHDVACYDKIGAALDRFTEAHFWVHMLEEYYHQADPFRWHVNAFLKAIKEIPDLISMSLQNEAGFPIWFRPIRKELDNDPLISVLAKKRDFVVHRSMLLPSSSGYVGITEGRGMKLGLTWPIDPLEDSDLAMQRFLWAISKNGDFFGFLKDDEDSLPCVERTWRIPDFEGELIDLCASAWKRTGETINQVAVWLGAQTLPFTLDCRHSPDRVRFKLYQRADLRKRLKAIRAQNRTTGSGPGSASPRRVRQRPAAR